MDQREHETHVSIIENKLKTLGLGDGLANGQDKNFQTSLDRGFFEGFKNGFVLGEYKAILFIENMQNDKEIVQMSDLLKTERAWCQLCSDPNIQNDHVESVIAQQTKVSTHNVLELWKTYNKKISKRIVLSKAV